MLISRRRLQQTRGTHMKTRLCLPAADGQPFYRMVTVSKAMLDCGVQMLLANEKALVSEDSDTQIFLRNYGSNNFSLEATHLGSDLPWTARITPSSIYCSGDQQSVPNNKKQAYDAMKNTHFGNVAHHIHKQMLPLYSECVLASRDMQDCFGKITYPVLQQQYMTSNKKMSDSFMLDNSVTISMLTDMLNRKWHRNLKEALHSDSDNTLPVYSVQYAARLLFLASVFCTTAPPPQKSSLFHVSQTRMTEMPAGMQDLLWSAMKPERNGVSLLLKGSSAEQRVMRCNLAVRIVDAEHKFATESMPSVMGMNASGSKTDVMLVSGVMNGIAAAIYIDSDTVDENSHQVATAAYMARGSFWLPGSLLSD